MTSVGGNADRGIEVVASDVQAVRGSAAWCATMQVCWDNMMETLCDGGPLNPLGGTSELVRALNASRLGRGALPKITSMRIPDQRTIGREEREKPRSGAALANRARFSTSSTGRSLLRA